MEEGDKEDSVHVGEGNVSRDESFFSELEQTENFIEENMEIDSDGNDDYSLSSGDEAQEDDRRER